MTKLLPIISLIINLVHTLITASLILLFPHIPIHIMYSQVKCVDVIDTNSSTCTIMISGMSLTVSYITNMYYHYKVLQVMLLQDWDLQLSQTLQLHSTGHLLLFILTV